LFSRIPALPRTAGDAQMAGEKIAKRLKEELIA